MKAVIFILFAAACFWIFRFSGLRQYLTWENLEGFVKSWGAAGPLVFIAIYAAGVCLFVPATVFTAAGAVLFGPVFGFVYNELGAMLGAALSFFIGRYLGRDFTAQLIGDRLKKYDDAIGRNGFMAVLYLRLLFFPFTLLNFGMGLTKVRFRDYFFGTLLGILAGGFILTFFIATVAEAAKAGDYMLLFNYRSVLSLLLFVFSFYIPFFVRKTAWGRRYDQV